MVRVTLVPDDPGRAAAPWGALPHGTLRARFWGTRGSVPSPGPRTVRYGGNTPCVEVRTARGALIVLDAGTGMRALGEALRGAGGGAEGAEGGGGRGRGGEGSSWGSSGDRSEGSSGGGQRDGTGGRNSTDRGRSGSEERGKRERGGRDDGRGERPGLSLHLFLTHAHWDHIQGLPFFAPLYDAGTELTIWGGPDTGPALEQAVRAQMSRTVFPVHFDTLAARVRFEVVPPAGTALDDVVVTTAPAHHPGGAVGYRVTGADGASLVYLSDNELAAPEAYPPAPGWREALVAFVAGAGVLVHDSTYTPAEYPARRGWGHSRDEDAVRLALEAGVQRLLLFHHHPERTDDALDARVAACHALAHALGGTLRVDAAAEGMVVEVAASGAR